MENIWIAMVFIAGMFSGVFVIFLAMRQRSEALERQHRERMALIERGHIPPAAPVRRASPSLSLSLGIIVVGIGFAIMTIISIAAAEPGVGIGVGGAIVIVGVAFIVRSFVVRPAEPEPAVPPVPSSPAPGDGL